MGREMCSSTQDSSSSELRHRRSKDPHPPISSSSSSSSSSEKKTKTKTKTTTVARSIASDYNRPILKLGIISISLAVLPIATYFGTLGRVFQESNTTGPAISAILVTNIILIGYILMAVFESEELETGSTEPKGQGPR